MTSFLRFSPLRAIVVLVALNTCLRSVSGDLEPLFDRCCQIGSSWTKNHTSCSGPSTVIPGVTMNDRSTCYTVIYVCCIRSHRATNCERGMNTARLGRTCDVLPIHGGETHKDCCDGCTLGLKVSSMRMSCALTDFAFGSPWDRAFMDCCINSSPDQGTSPLSGGTNRCKTQNPCSQVCDDSGEQIRCSCYVGYHLSSDQRTCEDDDECQTETHSCNRVTHVCVNSNGGFQCVDKGTLPAPSQNVQGGRCPVGYQWNQATSTCDDIDECTLGVCSTENEVCVNSIGSFTCTTKMTPCQPGFRHQATTNRCIDVDECAEGIHTCDREEEQCLNSHGAYLCQLNSRRSKDCSAGLKWNEGQARCEDVDECTEKLDDCDPASEECRNTVGGYECDSRCPQGLNYDERQQKCIDVDECVEGLHTCKAGQTCVNTSPNYRCVVQTPSLCPPGYKPTPAIDGNPPSCVDVDECLEDLHSCDRASEICINNIGSYRCVRSNELRQQQILCPSGFKYNTDHGNCEDLDECAEGVDYCDRSIETCENLNGTYSCHLNDPKVVCSPGFRVNSVTKDCEDINECAEDRHNCKRGKEMCFNVLGGFQCYPLPSCESGFVFSAEKNSCTDVDECAENLHNCNPASEVCQNALGNFVCVPRALQCPYGYRKNSDEDKCEDINECIEQTDDCDRSRQYCVNTLGSYQCQTKSLPPGPRCGTGYYLDGATGICKDIDECASSTHRCSAPEVCLNTPGSFSCLRPFTETPPSTWTFTSRTEPPTHKTRSRLRTTTPAAPRTCHVGFVYSIALRSCVDIDECVEATPCSSDQTCENTIGSYQCRCQQGYTADHVNRTCKDVNECQLGLHSCGQSQRCDNTIGSYTCVRTTSCGTGYTLNAGLGECEDDDECALQSHNCGPGFVCRNTLGSFRCDRVRCPPGQKLLPDGSCQVIACTKGMEPDASGNCVDINECSRTNACRINQRCINSVGSYRCQNLLNCGAGFELNESGNRCVDIDECARRIDECGSQQSCRNRPGGYVCECPPGYSLNAQRACEDVDECTRFQSQVCSVNSECQNTQGSYVCNCKEGFKKGEDGKNCIDNDECAESPGICHQNCINAWGSYHCSCRPGFVLQPDERSCKDIDECSLWEGKGSLCIGFCVNEPGSYSCSCPDGYRLAPDKRTCQDIDECQEQGVCKGQNEVCLNTRGSFRCNTITCPPKYERDRDHRNRCKRSELGCPADNSDCLKDPVSFSYNFITFVSNMRIPPSGQLDLFTMRGPRFAFTTVQFSLELKDARSPEGVPTATRENFHLRRTAFNEAMMSLGKTIPGPQEIELELVMKMYHNGLFGGTAIAKIFIFVTRYEF